MNEQIDAKYFDGQSSAPWKIKVLYDEVIDGVHLQIHEEDFLVWHLKDLRFEQHGEFIEIRNNNYSGAILRIQSIDFSKELQEAMKQSHRADIHKRLLNLGFSKIIAIAVGLLAVIVLAYFYVLPPVAEKSAVLLPESFDDKMGSVFMESFLDEVTIDSAKSKKLEEFAEELNLGNSKPLHFTVVESDDVNAFALPNGQIVVYTAILDGMDNSDQLVALLGHEASHVNNRHSIKMLCRNLAGYLVISLLFSDVNGIMTVLADNARQLQSLSYSRKFEEEADEQGLRILMNNNVNPNGMVHLFDQLDKESKFSIPKMLSTHPLTKERKTHMRKIISKSTYKIQPNSKLTSIFQSIQN